MNSIYGLTFEKLNDYILSCGYKSFRTKQIWKWLYKDLISDFSLMTDVKKEMIEKISADFILLNLKISEKEVSNDNNTIKYLFELNDGNLIETVLMKQSYGYSICVTTQVGCNMGCKFCASGILKKRRNLDTSEIVSQVILASIDLGIRISSLVVMGIGEPFDNYDNVIDFLSIINDPQGLCIGARHITVSTCGIIPKINEFAKLGIQYNLAISLHAATNEKRDLLMPINKALKLNDLIDCIKKYIELTNRRVTIEYILIDKVNDTLSDAKELTKLLKGLNVLVNLIPYNPVSELNYKRSLLENRKIFYKTLCDNKIVATLRREFGSDISAACGQLRSQNITNKDNKA